MLARRCVEVTYKTIRQRCLKFGQSFANKLRRRRADPGDKWHLDEMVLKIKGQPDVAEKDHKLDRMTLEASTGG